MITMSIWKFLGVLDFTRDKTSLLLKHFFFKFFDEWLCVYDHFGICLFGWLLCPAAIF